MFRPRFQVRSLLVADNLTSPRVLNILLHLAQLQLLWGHLQVLLSPVLGENADLRRVAKLFVLRRFICPSSFVFLLTEALPLSLNRHIFNCVHRGCIHSIDRVSHHSQRQPRCDDVLSDFRAMFLTSCYFTLLPLDYWRHSCVIAPQFLYAPSQTCSRNFFAMGPAVTFLSYHWPSLLEERSSTLVAEGVHLKFTLVAMY
jgi:hypothetical protein